MDYRSFLPYRSVFALLLLVAFALSRAPVTAAPLELKTSQGSLFIDAEGRVSLEPGDAVCPAPLPFKSPLWLITLAEGSDPFRPGKTITTRESDPPKISRTEDGVRLLYDGICQGDKKFDITNSRPPPPGGNSPGPVPHGGGTQWNDNRFGRPFPDEPSPICRKFSRRCRLF